MLACGVCRLACGVCRLAFDVCLLASTVCRLESGICRLASAFCRLASGLCWLASGAFRLALAALWANTKNNEFTFSRYKLSIVANSVSLQTQAEQQPDSDLTVTQDDSGSEAKFSGELS